MRSGLCRVVSPHLVTYLRACARVGVDNRGTPDTTRHKLSPGDSPSRLAPSLLSHGPFPALRRQRMTRRPVVTKRSIARPPSPIA